MNRKDTIIVAVLVNAAILIALFISAVKTENREHDLASDSHEVLEKSAPFLKRDVEQKPIMKMAQGDEIDQVLKQYAQPAAPSFAAASEMQTEVKPEPIHKIPDFSEDLKAISAPSSLFSQPAVAVAEKRGSEIIEVIVKKGDALEKIARAQQTTVDEIMKLNQMKTSKLSIGQTLKVRPGGEKKRGKFESSSKRTADSAVQYYTVKNGDNPWTIAVKNQLKLEELLKLNHLDEEKARRLKPGDQLRIR